MLTNSMNFQIFAIAGILCLMAGCGHHQPPLDIQGHRGARGLYPENTIPAFVFAAELGVTTLEMDVVVSADGKIVVSHEPWMSSGICSHPDGAPVTAAEETSLNLYKMTYDEIKKHDCGSRGNARFPQQRKMAVSKPLLSEVIETIEKLTAWKNLKPVQYNIETKSMPGGENIYHPPPPEFARLLLDEIKKHHIGERTIVQSFDVRTLQEMKKLAPEIRLALLAASGDYDLNAGKLGFTPSIYSPDYHLVNESLIIEVHGKKAQVIPWTVNDSTEMKKLIDMGVDGIITDYPDIGMRFIGSRH